MRLFFAIELPVDVQAVLGQLRPPDDSHDYRWVEPSLLHVTLAFLGEQPPERLATLREVGSAAAQDGTPGILELGRAGSFGSRSAPRVLWVDLDGDLDALVKLHRALSIGLRGAAFPIDDRPFRPHITLARRRETARGGPPSGWPPSLNVSTRFEMQQLTLVQSRLNPHGATYVPLEQFALGS